MPRCPSEIRLMVGSLNPMTRAKAAFVRDSSRAARIVALPKIIDLSSTGTGFGSIKTFLLKDWNTIRQYFHLKAVQVTTAQHLSYVPMQHGGSPKEMGHAILWLLSGKANT